MSGVKCNCPWNPDSHHETCPVYMRDRIADLAAENQRLREALTGAGIWIKDVTNVVLFPLANEVQGGLGAEADSFGGCTPELLRGIDAALTTANGEVT
jgi:hypothetical protein